MIHKEKRFHKRPKYYYPSIALSLAAVWGLSGCSATKPAMNQALETETEVSAKAATKQNAQGPSQRSATGNSENESFDFEHLEASLKLLQLQYSEDFTFALNLPALEFPVVPETESEADPDSHTSDTGSGHSDAGSRISGADSDFSDPDSQISGADSDFSHADSAPGESKDRKKGKSSEERSDSQEEDTSANNHFSGNANTEAEVSHVILPENFAYNFPVVPGTFKGDTELRQFPLPTLPLNISVLENRIIDQLDTYSGTWSVYVKNLTTGDSLLIGDQPMKSASVMKLFIMGAVYTAIDRGDVERTEEVVTLLNDMISYSSNEASNRLLALLGRGSYERGIDKVNQYIEEHRYEGDTHEYNGFNDVNTIMDEDHFNQVSAKDCGKLLERIYRRTFASRKVCNEIETMMLNQNTRYKIPAGLPEGVSVGNKTGEMDTVENDAAIIYGDKSDYILCVLSSDWDSKNNAISHIAKLSSIVYEFFNDDSYYLEAPDLTAYDFQLVEAQADLPEETEGMELAEEVEGMELAEAQADSPKDTE